MLIILTLPKMANVPSNPLRLPNPFPTGNTLPKAKTRIRCNNSPTQLDHPQFALMLLHGIPITEVFTLHLTAEPNWIIAFKLSAGPTSKAPTPGSSVIPGELAGDMLATCMLPLAKMLVVLHKNALLPSSNCCLSPVFIKITFSKNKKKNKQEKHTSEPQSPPEIS